MESVVKRLKPRLGVAPRASGRHMLIRHALFSHFTIHTQNAQKHPLGGGGGGSQRSIYLFFCYVSCNGRAL